MLQSPTTTTFDTPQSAANRLIGLDCTEQSALLRDRFLTELAHYEADKPFLTVDKCAARCRWLSLLLTAAVTAVDTHDGPALH